ncbi:hypothetical protein ABZ023_30930 [Streptomyces sp. NPDC006367]|uniref:hypothetical protein n=1 Tax=unclassified Streptomyces TaxID=2593676 RepID=UPI0033AC7B0A
MSHVLTHAEHVAAELEACAAYRDVFNHGYIGDSKPHRYAAAAGNLADALADNPGTRTVTALTANRAHPESGRAPKPSAKAGRAALRATGRLTRQDRHDHPTAAHMIHAAARDAITDAFHHAADAHHMDPEDVLDLHAARAGDRFPHSVTYDVRALVFLVGDLIALACAYGSPEALLTNGALEVYADERGA